MFISQGEVWGGQGADKFIGATGEGYPVIYNYTFVADIVRLLVNGTWNNVEFELIFAGGSGDSIMLLVGINEIEQIILVQETFLLGYP
ncbi:hypothetical protein MITS9509_02759 [Synechococcus sp. MIT S9509]|uniref:hypothetical protein n=1 Tax=unclassified Synechococcus TaxID=2626047 RepID=UPI0007BC61A9|nr:MULTISPECIES: hypothetical protein [unclassified Synechococcus]KZR85576.1 hypothetical protein MITS9504_02113 [Synechococcus sp. MIT S9504]KZR90470.1 hypothetical protein MITS9509_02759 [Synechococcus sp. MIT S9509]